ncbi:hypothetical protein HZA38_00035 [Candidatus Peregrinibacteria bacterium]|nr:hypothetical protein [Candidatus Peregrinibacteria bacterium]
MEELDSFFTSKEKEVLRREIYGLPPDAPEASVQEARIQQAKLLVREHWGVRSDAPDSAVIEAIRKRANQCSEALTKTPQLFHPRPTENMLWND